MKFTMNVTDVSVTSIVSLGIAAVSLAHGYFAHRREKKAREELEKSLTSQVTETKAKLEADARVLRNDITVSCRNLDKTCDQLVKENIEVELAEEIGTELTKSAVEAEATRQARAIAGNILMKSASVIREAADKAVNNAKATIEADTRREVQSRISKIDISSVTKEIIRDVERDVRDDVRSEVRDIKDDFKRDLEKIKDDFESDIDDMKDKMKSDIEDLRDDSQEEYRDFIKEIKRSVSSATDLQDEINDTLKLRRKGNK